MFLTVWALSEDADLDAARAQLAAEADAEGGEPLPEGWLAAFTQSYGAAALDGRFLVVNGDGRLYRVDLDAPELAEIDTGFAKN